MALELGEGHASRAVPNAGRFVFGGGDDSRAVWAKDGGSDTAAMSLERNEGGACRAVPNAGRLVFGGGDDSRAVGAESRADDRTAMSLAFDRTAPVSACQMRAVLSRKR